MRNIAFGARIRTVAQLFSRKPPATETRHASKIREEHEKIFQDLQRRETEMSSRYLETTHIAGVRTYLREILHNAIEMKHEKLGVHWICGHCQRGDLGFNPHVGEYCPHCTARIEEIIRRNNRGS